MSSENSARDVLGLLNVGSSVAEHDTDLQNYFVETATFTQIIKDRADIIAGDKGTGKSALYRILTERMKSEPGSRGIKVIAAFNPAGTPVFQQITSQSPMDEGDYIAVWKSYFLALAGNSLLEEGNLEDSSAKRLDQLLRAIDLRSDDAKVKTVFARIFGFVKQFLHPSASEQTFFSHDGMPIVRNRLEFEPEAEIQNHGDRIPYDDALDLLNDILDEADVTVWLVMDRLDEAFQGKPDHEQPALRALFRAYLDLSAFKRIRLKLFVRRDLFARIIEGGFVNLTHINARRIEIVWDNEDLYSLLYRRLQNSPGLLEALSLDESASEDELFSAIFPVQVDPGDRKARTWPWILSRIRDGNDVRPPRNLIDLVSKAKEAQERAESRSPRDWCRGTPVITSDALKRGLESLSEQRIQDTLLAEAGGNAELVEKFRDGKAEHTRASLRDIMGPDWSVNAKFLESIGFLERVGGSWKVPMLYRSGLGITQGKAPASELE